MLLLIIMLIVCYVSINYTIDYKSLLYNQYIIFILKIYYWNNNYCSMLDDRVTYLLIPMLCCNSCFYGKNKTIVL